MLHVARRFTAHDALWRHIGIAALQDEGPEPIGMIVIGPVIVIGQPMMETQSEWAEIENVPVEVRTLFQAARLFPRELRKESHDHVP